MTSIPSQVCECFSSMLSSATLRSTASGISAGTSSPGASALATSPAAQIAVKQRIACSAVVSGTTRCRRGGAIAGSGLLAFIHQRYDGEANKAICLFLRRIGNRFDLDFYGDHEAAFGG